MKIYAPVENATGTWCNVQFRNGVGETNDPHLIKWFVEHGYTVSEPQISEYELPVVPTFESMTPNELRDWAKANGLGRKIKNYRNREKLLEIILGEDKEDSEVE